MASFLFLPFLSLTLFLSLSSAARNLQPRMHVTAPIPLIQQVCKATRFPDTCQASLAGLVTDPNTTPIQAIQSSIKVSTDGLHTAQKMVKAILDSSAGNQNRTTAANNCLDDLVNSQYRISLATDNLSRGSIKNTRASMSAALLYQYGCWSGLKYANDTQMINETMSFLDSLVGKSSNALSMMFSYYNFGNDTKLWAPPKTERDGFWERVEGRGSGQEVRGGVPSNLTADVTVCKEKTKKCYRTVQRAVNAAPDNAGEKKFVIRIKAGVYNEIVRVPLKKRNVVFLGDGIGKTVITGSLNVGMPGISTYNSATVEEFLKLYQNNPEVHKSYLGRPWKEYSRTVFINCTMEALLSPDGWMTWSEDFALSTLFYGEFGNSGAGSDFSKRVPFSSKIPSEHVNAYSVQNFIQGNEWIST
ncbi:hypothetical protein GBA52_008032 [Prunus armeniaca]|nr:hypothetical protein GBA52_008032 [Prunus armeniaca]